MPPKILEHLNRVEEAVTQLDRILAKNNYPGDSRTVIVVSLLDTMIEHHRGMLLLVRNGMIGSAFALARSIVESMYRGSWVNLCATEEQIRAFEVNDVFPLGIGEMARALDETYGAAAGGCFADLKKRGWPGLCSYAHSGVLQLDRRFKDQKVQPNYSDAEIYEATMTVTTCTVSLAARFLAVQNHVEESKAIETLTSIYAPDIA